MEHSAVRLRLRLFLVFFLATLRPGHAAAAFSRKCVVAVTGDNGDDCHHCHLAGREVRRYLRLTSAEHVGASVPLVVVPALGSNVTIPSACGDADGFVFVGRWADAAAPVLLHDDSSGEISRLARDARAALDGSGSPDAHLLASIVLADGRPAHVLSGASDLAVLYAAYAFSERVLGARFYPHGDVVRLLPFEAASSVWEPSRFASIAASLVVGGGGGGVGRGSAGGAGAGAGSDGAGHVGGGGGGGGSDLRVGVVGEAAFVVAAPDFEVRGANTWGTWTEGFDWWTPDNWRGFVSQLVKMRCNFIGMHSCVRTVLPW
jgi:hypothetical protein